MADVVVRGLTLTERGELTRVARKHRMTQNKFMLQLVRQAIGSDGKTDRKRESWTQRIAREELIPGQETDEQKAWLATPAGNAWLRRQRARDEAAGAGSDVTDYSREGMMRAMGMHEQLEAEAQAGRRPSHE